MGFRPAVMLPTFPPSCLFFLIFSLVPRTLLVDPPRAGLDPATCKLMSEFDKIVYISCNPETLHANLQGIAGVTHDIKRFAAFDQFPFTTHCEVGAYLVRKPAAAAP